MLPELRVVIQSSLEILNYNYKHSSIVILVPRAPQGPPQPEDGRASLPGQAAPVRQRRLHRQGAFLRRESRLPRRLRRKRLHRRPGDDVKKLVLVGIDERAR
jgi:hypothetical protein